jgi:hypothetical protein
MPAMSTKSREVIFGSQIAGARIRADEARKRAREAVREADRAEAEAWSIRMEGSRSAESDRSVLSARNRDGSLPGREERRLIEERRQLGE